MSFKRLLISLAAPAALLTLSACAVGLPTQVSRFQAMPAPAGQSFVIRAEDRDNLRRALEAERAIAVQFVRRPRRDPPAEGGDRGPRPRRGRATVHGVSLRQLFSDREPDLPRLYAYPDGHWLRANMVATADGAASLNGLTQGISSDTDRRVFALLRTLCDVILVGASTVREEKYKPARPQELWSHLREGRPPTPETIALPCFSRSRRRRLLSATLCRPIASTSTHHLPIIFTLYSA